MTEPDPRIIAALEAHKGEIVQGDFFIFTASIVEPIIRERESKAWDNGYIAGADAYGAAQLTPEHVEQFTPSPYRDIT